MKNRVMTRSCLLAILILAWGLSIVLAAGELKATEVPKQLLKTDVFVDLTIMGDPIATREQCVDYLFRRNPFPLINTTPKELVDYYYVEGGREGIRPDVAFAQALHETGNFRYGGDVISLQNNYCGLGTTGQGVKGAWFSSPEIGVRAQIQHLLAYTTTRPPSLPIVDPRYELVKRSEKFGQSYTWTDLNGKWAVPGKTYGQMILKIHEKILTGQ
ncbi:glucosaminidase domain-containing protein [Pelosinus sp. sgz500959]|uniref:glucosaminidase domain-containing protein n=1 Tax=Pelosinus sp. sgz500959 TaxID=3242472 RepID=UPI00366A8C53